MKKDVMISIRGCPRGETYTEDEDIELTTAGKLYRKNGKYYITYRESELTRLEGVTTTLKVEERRVTLMRNGPFPTQMVFEQGKRNFGLYDTPEGALTVAVATRRLSTGINDDGGNLSIDYSIEIENILASENLLSMTLE